VKKILAFLMCFGLLAGMGSAIVGCKTEEKKTPATTTTDKKDDKKPDEKKPDEKKDGK